MTRFLILALALSLGACAPDLQALAQDRNSDCVTMTSVWFTLHFDRNWGCEPPARTP